MNSIEIKPNGREDVLTAFYLTDIDGMQAGESLQMAGYAPGECAPRFPPATRRACPQTPLSPPGLTSVASRAEGQKSGTCPLYPMRQQHVHFNSSPLKPRHLCTLSCGGCASSAERLQCGGEKATHTIMLLSAHCPAWPSLDGTNLPMSRYACC